MRQCTHTGTLPRPEPEPRSRTCPECLAEGTHPVHLRLCLTCGNVGCCDSSRDGTRPGIMNGPGIR